MAGSIVATVRRRARPLVHAGRRLWQRLERTVRPVRTWDGRHHPALLRFPPWEGEADGTFCHDFLGVRTDPRFRPQFRPDPRGPLRTRYPAPHAGYFEWIVVLESVAAARGTERFTMIELGAGYGAWLVAAARAAARLGGPSVYLVGVEMVPHHYRWMREHFRNNGLDPDAHRLLQAAVSDYDGVAVFRQEPDRRFDFGQKIRRRRAGAPTEGGGAEEAPCLRLGPLLERCGTVDLLHVDIQGEELRALGVAMDDLGRRVRRVIVATHTRAIHRNLRRRFALARWRTLYDFGLRRRERTPFGDVQFLDGLLAFENPALQEGGRRDPI